MTINSAGSNGGASSPDAYPDTYYAATARKAPLRPALEGVKQVDVCVIGGGYTGLSTALHCAERGLSVVVLEGRRIGWGASGLNGGQVVPGWNRTTRGLIQQFGEAQARTLFAMAEAAVEGLWERVERHNISCDAQRGHLMVASTPSDMHMLEAEAEARRNIMGYDHSRLVDRETANRLSGGHDFHGGLLDSRGGHVHPLNLALGLAAAAELSGARLHENSRVVRLRPSAARMLVETRRGKVLARNVVLACGAQSGELLEPVKRRTSALTAFAAATAPLSAEETATLVKDGLAVCDTRMSVNYFHMSPDNRLLFGGGGAIPPRPRRVARSRGPPPAGGGVSPTHRRGDRLRMERPRLAHVQPHARRRAGGAGVLRRRLFRARRGAGQLHGQGADGSHHRRPHPVRSAQPPAQPRRARRALAAHAHLRRHRRTRRPARGALELIIIIF